MSKALKNEIRRYVSKHMDEAFPWQVDRVLECLENDLRSEELTTERLIAVLLDAVRYLADMDPIEVER